MPSIPTGSASASSQNPMTGTLIPVGAPQQMGHPEKPITAPSSTTTSGGFFDGWLDSSEKSGHAGDMEMNSYDGSKPGLLSQAWDSIYGLGKDLFSSKPKENTFYYFPSNSTTIRKSLQHPTATAGSETGGLASIGTKYDELTKLVGEKWQNATPMERGLAIGIPTALAAGAGALYLRKKLKEDKSKGSKK